MSQPTPPVLQYSFLADPNLDGNTGSHLDDDFQVLVDSLTETITNLGLIQRDDGLLQNGVIFPEAFGESALVFIAGSATNPDGVEWKPRGDWVTATLYKVGNVVQFAFQNYWCVTEHVSGTFVTDFAAGKWMLSTSIPTVTSGLVISALGYTPLNKAGDTSTGLTIFNASLRIYASGPTFSDTYLAQDLLAMDKGLYSVYSTTAPDIAYGFASNVVRSSGAFLTVGGQFSAYGTSGITEGVFGGNLNAIAMNGFAGGMVGCEFDIASFTPNNTSQKRAIDLVFANRANSGGPAGNYSYTFPFGSYTIAAGGLGNNHYNRNSRAINISSQARSSTGEYCGFTRGIMFDGACLDSEADAAYPAGRAYPIGIDFSTIPYLGGSDPVTAYNMEAAIAMRDLQTIWWNRDPALASSPAISKIRTYFNPFTLRWVIANGATERLGIDVTTGTIYQNGVAFTGGVSLAGNNTWTGTNTFNNTVTVGSNLVFSGNGRRIQAEFDTGTLTNRTVFQTKNANLATEVGAIPNGSATQAGFYVITDSGMASGVVGRLGCDTNGVLLSSTTIGGFAAQPLLFSSPGGSMQLSATGALLVNTTSAPVTGAKLRVNGLIQCDNTAAFSANLGGLGYNVADGTITQIPFTTEEFDVGGYYNTGTQRFTPPAGKYLLCGATRTDAASVDQGIVLVMIYKNGVQHKSGNFSNASGTGSCGSTVTAVVDANGTDYFDLRTFQDNGAGSTLTFNGAATDTYFCGYRIG